MPENGSFSKLDEVDMKMKTLLFVLLALLGTSIQSSFAGTENCTQLEKLLLRHQKAAHDIKEEEWFVWDPKKSSVEVARFVEREDGTWGFARLSKGELPLHTHKQEEWYFIKQGLGRMQLGDAVYMVEPGEKIYIPGNIGPPHEPIRAGCLLSEPIDWLVCRSEEDTS